MENCSSSSAQDELDVIRSIPQTGKILRNVRKKGKGAFLRKRFDKNTIQKFLLGNVRKAIENYHDQVGQHIGALVYTGDNPPVKIFGTNPLIDILRKMSPDISRNLRDSMCIYDDIKTDEFRLPPLVANGVPTPLHSMTQAHLRAFIPFMLKYATGRGKPGWGREDAKPPWWPQDIPWANVRVDTRSQEQKLLCSWKSALMKIICNCYTYHDREDLLDQGGEIKEKLRKRNTDTVKSQVAEPKDFLLRNTDQLHDKFGGNSNIPNQTDLNNTVSDISESVPDSANIQYNQSSDEYNTPQDVKTLYIMPYVANVMHVFPTSTTTNINQNVAYFISNQDQSTISSLNMLDVTNGTSIQQQEIYYRDITTFTEPVIINDAQPVLSSDRYQILDHTIVKDQVVCIQNIPEAWVHHAINVPENRLTNNVIEFVDNNVQNYQKSQENDVARDVENVEKKVTVLEDQNMENLPY